jgi:hypothetical protein
MLSPKMGMEAHTYNPFQNIILFRKPRQDDHEFKDSLGYIMRPCLKINEERKKERRHAKLVSILDPLLSYFSIWNLLSPFLHLADSFII